MKLFESFDPWSATYEEAAHAQQVDGAHAPLSQWHAAREVRAARGACERPDGGGEVLRCVGLCLAHGLVAPAWLATQFMRRRATVVNAFAASWDDSAAFGRPWPKNIKEKRLALMRQRIELRKRVYAGVWTLVKQSPARAFTRPDLFDEVSEMRGINKSGSVVMKLYYEAIAAGEVDARAWRDSLRAQPSVYGKPEEDSGDSA